MKTKKINLKYKGKKIPIKLEVCSSFGKFRGLMFRRRENAPALLFEFKKPKRWPIHSLFVFFPFVAIWLNDKNKIVETKRVESWRLKIKPKMDFSKLIEIPINKKYKSVIKLFDDNLLLIDGSRKV